MIKFLSQDKRFVIVSKTNQHFNEYKVFETEDLERANIDFENLDADILLKECSKSYPAEDPRFIMVVKWDGCSNMYACANEIEMHFCDESHIISFYGAMSQCYAHARNQFNFD